MLPDGGIKTINITSDTKWTATAESSQSWLTVTPASGYRDGSVLLTADENPSSAPRRATVTFTYGPNDETIILKVTQSGQATPINPV